MATSFQVYRQGPGSYHALPSSPAWLALPLPWLWTARHRLWLPSLFLLLPDLVVAALLPSLAASQPLALLLVLAVPRAIAVLRGHEWMGSDWEDRNRELIGPIAARDRADAVAQVARRQGVIPHDLRPRSETSAWSFPPASVRPGWAVARLAIRAAFRYRLVVVLLVLILATVGILPVIIKHDETAQGFTQILLTYTLGIITALLSLVTLWLACGTLARDVDECQMQMVATKPIPRWQIWLGKWTGIMLLNVMLLAVAGTAVYLLMQWRATQLPAEVQEQLRNNVLTARAAVREPPPDLRADVEAMIRQRLPELQAQNIDLNRFRAEALEVARARQQLVPPDYFRRFRLDLRHLRGGPPPEVYVRVKFFSPDFSTRRPYELEFQAGPPDSPDRRSTFRPLAAEATHEIPLGPVPLDADGFLIVEVANRSGTPLILPIDDGFEVLYQQGGFGPNYVRALLVVACWLGLLAAIGLAAASFLSFPVAAFLATTILVLGLSTGTLRSVVEDGTVLGLDHETNQPKSPALDAVMVPVFQAVLGTVNLVRGFSPIDAVSTGRSVRWIDVLQATGIVVVLIGGAFAAIGITAFTRRELATAQANH